jgi:hypothetical protein
MLELPIDFSRVPHLNFEEKAGYKSFVDNYYGKEVRELESLGKRVLAVTRSAVI